MPPLGRACFFTGLMVLFMLPFGYPLLAIWAASLCFGIAGVSMIYVGLAPHLREAMKAEDECGPGGHPPFQALQDGVNRAVESVRATVAPRRYGFDTVVTRFESEDRARERSLVTKSVAAAIWVGIAIGIVLAIINGIGVQHG